ncbi:MAG: response regulator [Myxococcales bacterium]|nr:response regulator [Myxococcales bacterium]
MQNKKYNVLLVDDEPYVLKALSRSLRNFEVHRATGYDEAMTVIEEDAPLDAIVSDCAMPGPGGLVLLERAAAIRPETLRILLSGNPPPEASPLREREVIHRIVVKPWPATFVEELQRSLDSRSSARPA